MRATLTIVGVILIVFGCIWFLQGVSVAAGQLHERANQVGRLWRLRRCGGYLDIGGVAERVGRSGRPFERRKIANAGEIESSNAEAEARLGRGVGQTVEDRPAPHQSRRLRPARPDAPRLPLHRFFLFTPPSRGEPNDSGLMPRGSSESSVQYVGRREQPWISSVIRTWSAPGPSNARRFATHRRRRS